MQTYISILRGINVSGHRIIKMDALKTLCLSLDFYNIKTYIQSGNIIFEAIPTDNKIISNAIKSAIEKEFGFDVPIITLRHSELDSIITSNPFVNDKSKDPSFFHVTFLSDRPTKQDIEQLTQIDLRNDKYEIIDKVIYLFCPDSYSNSKLTNSLFEKKLKVTATTRNWKTTNELLNLTTK